MTERARLGAVCDGDGDSGAVPFINAADVLGLYRPDVAAAASKQTACDPGSGPTRIDD